MRSSIKTLLLAGVFLLVCSVLSGCWMSGGGGRSFLLGDLTRCEAKAVALDSTGNIYVTGGFNYTVDFDPGPGVDNRTSTRETDAYLTKFDPSGKFLWARNWGGAGTADSYSLAIDGDGNIYITGEFFSTVDFDPGPGVGEHSSLQLNNTFLSKFDSDGNFLWAHTWWEGNPARGYGVAVDDWGDIYVTGDIRGTVDLDPGPGVDEHTSKGLKDIYVSKFDSSGGFLWARTFGMSNFGYSSGVVIDSTGNACVTGYFQRSIEFDPGIEANVSNGGDDIYLGKYDPGGNFLWAITLGGKGNDNGYGVTVDSEGGVYIAGRFSGTVDLDPGPGVDEHNSNGESDIYLCKFDSSGKFLWARTWGGTARDYSHGTAIDKNDNPYVCGRFSGTVDFDPGEGLDEHSSDIEYDAYLTKYDSAGNFLWARTFGEANYAESSGVAFDGSGNAYITGRFNGDVDFDTGPDVEKHRAVGSMDVFLSMFDPDGNFMWVRTWGAPGSK